MNQTTSNITTLYKKKRSWNWKDTTGLMVLLLLLIFYIISSNLPEKIQGFSADADVARLEHLAYWSGLIEEYHETQGQYPFQDKTNEKVVMVRIANKFQSKYFTPESTSYTPALDLAKNDFYNVFTIDDFVTELEQGLGRDVQPLYDIQKVPTGSPVWYHYMVSKDAYLLYAPCNEVCGNWNKSGGYKSNIATLVTYFENATPVVKITSGIPSKKTFLREELLQNKTYQSIVEKGYSKPDFVKIREVDDEGTGM